MTEKQNRRYEWAIKRQMERLKNGLKYMPAEMISALEDFAEGKDVPRPVVERAMRELLSLMTLPVMPCLSGVYTPKEFWRREPVAKLITKCRARLTS